MLKIPLKKHRRRKRICHGSNPKQMSENEISNHQGPFGIIYVLFLCFYFWNSFFDTCFYEIYIKEQCFVCIGETGFPPQILVYIFFLENRKTTFFLFLIFFFVFLFLNCISLTALTIKTKPISTVHISFQRNIESLQSTCRLSLHSRASRWIRNHQMIWKWETASIQVSWSKIEMFNMPNFGPLIVWNLD